MVINTENLSTLTSAGGNVVGSDGDKIGSIGEIYFDDETSRAKWVTVKTGLFGTSFVPLQDATQQGNDIAVPYTKDKVKHAPRVAKDGHLEAEEQDQLATYYELSTASVADTANDGPATSENEHDVILHEERPVASTETVPVQRVRLNTETVTDDHLVIADVHQEPDNDGGTRR